MTLPEGLAGHCLTVIRYSSRGGREGWRGGEVKEKKREGQEQSERKREKEHEPQQETESERERETERDREREREREKERLEGRRNHRLLWRPILQASLPRPTLQDILDSSTLPRPPPQLLSFLNSFSCSPPFWFPTRQAFSRTLERCKSITMSTSAFYSNQLYAHKHRLLCLSFSVRLSLSLTHTRARTQTHTHVHTHTHVLALKNWGQSSARTTLVYTVPQSVPE